MRRLLLILFSLTCTILTFAQHLKDTSKHYRPFVQQLSENVKFKELPEYTNALPPLFISKEQVLADIDMLRYIIDNAFSGRDYWQQNGVDFNAMYDELQSYAASSNGHVSTEIIEETIYKYFRNINDAHTHIVGHRNREMVQSLRPFFAGIVLQKEGGKYIVVNTNDPAIRIGEVYMDSVRYLFRTLSKRGTEQYLVGKQSAEPLANLDLRFKNGLKKLSLHPSKIGELRFDDQPKIFESDMASAIPYIRSSSFATARGEQTLTEFMQSGTLLKNKTAFIWNIIDNHGGDGFYPATFIKNFNGTSWENSTELTLYSPVINQCYWKGRNSWIQWDKKSMKGLHDDNYPLDSIPLSKREKIRRIRLDKKTVMSNPVKKWEVTSPNHLEQGDYKGKAILLVSHRTNSAANNAVAFAKSIPGNIVVGENTGSAYTFANVKYYSLKCCFF